MNLSMAARRDDAQGGKVIRGSDCASRPGSRRYPRRPSETGAHRLIEPGQDRSMLTRCAGRGAPVLALRPEPDMRGSEAESIGRDLSVALKCDTLGGDPYQNYVGMKPLSPTLRDGATESGGQKRDNPAESATRRSHLKCVCKPRATSQDINLGRAAALVGCSRLRRAKSITSWSTKGGRPGSRRPSEGPAADAP